MPAFFTSTLRRSMPTLLWPWVCCGLLSLASLACQDEQTSRKLDVARSQILAEIGKELITKDDFQKALQQLSPFIRQQYNTPKRKAQFLEQLIQFELLVLEAKRKGYQTHPSVVRARHKAMIALLIKKIVQASKVNTITAAELRRYYDAKRKQDPALQKTPFQQLQQRLRKALRKQKQAQAYNAYLARLRKKYTVKIDRDLLAKIKPLPSKAPDKASPQPTRKRPIAPRPAVIPRPTPRPAAVTPRSAAQPARPVPAPSSRPTAPPASRPHKPQRRNAGAVPPRSGQGKAMLPGQRPTSRPTAPAPASAPASAPTSRPKPQPAHRPTSQPIQRP